MGQVLALLPEIAAIIWVIFLPLALEVFQ